jgi:imidazolonepropionase-like amidohydrolase
MGANGGKQTVILNGTLIDGSGAEATANNAIVINGNRIRSVGQLPGDVNLEDKANVEVIDATGQWVIPGLIDAHCHLSLRQPSIPGVAWPTSAEHATLWGARNAQRVLHSGVTSIACPGGKWFADVAVRNAVNAGLLEGPRIFCAERLLATVGSIGDRNAPFNPTPEDDTSVWTPTLETMAAEVRRQIKNGVDFIKIGDSELGHSQSFTKEELAHIVQEAHRRDVKVGIHSRGSGSTRAAAEAGVDCIFHLDLAVEEDLEAVAKAGAMILPTLTFMLNFAEFGGEVGASQRARDEIRRNAESCVRIMEIAHKMGIRMLAGTDAGNSQVTVHGECHMQEPEIFQKYIGLSPMEALVSVTSGNAAWVGLDGEAGLVQEGKLADILVLDSDPLSDITVLQDKSKMSTLIKDGRQVDLKASLPDVDVERDEHSVAFRGHSSF